MIVCEPSAEIAAWVGARIGVTFHPPYTTLAHVERGRIIAGFVFNVWTEHDIEISLAADRLSLTLMRAVFDYVFNQLGCRRATCRTRADNISAQRLLARVGAEPEGRQRGYFGDCDGLLYAIMKEDFPHGLHAKGPQGA
ncbi:MULTISPECIES: GNAT family protein [Rhizobium]|uniref:GNAT family N-acetyltransferase n=1 Tax=Rhizobium TaxID=379 RepID=UPI001B33017E|nr:MULTISPECIES: GNAT family protein [Rhizobium]MBX4908361.1 GNAT family N-acetyltransferase [Rhizobium bangladeshense]MBX5217246.1 GNAT family N-acetyltransferase [Rhizobium sp. NLR9a]MBX5222333.1 GNAT family N-acetyltransferase [Rhizobium sp. NLR8a]MBX5227637.1 GNAT family N-acetyltransferase [Rhizobium sp. NLR9b]MBX5233577.1 GNAT family N-acetyltransferase [Rhizobium sp. NLR4a]